jgi:hypothetical protein
MKKMVLLIMMMLPLYLCADNTEFHCEKKPEYQILNFWVGDWDVQDVDGQKVGSNRIEKILGGCAVVENWTELDGHEGKSFFYFNNPTGKWKQVWVEDSGGMKEKEFIQKFGDGGVRFQGLVQISDGSMILDRTTLTPKDQNHVKQVIEISRDQGKNWKAVFHAIYVRK